MMAKMQGWQFSLAGCLKIDTLVYSGEIFIQIPLYSTSTLPGTVIGKMWLISLFF